jgi:hypothetical protein
MNRNQVRLALLKISLVVLAGSTWIFSSFIFATRPEESEPDALTALVRLPASLPAQLPGALPGVFAPAVKVNEPIEMDTVKVACWDSNDEAEQETSARWIRLTGRPCQAAIGADAVTVRNLTNGYVATVFPTQPANALTTDFIPLQEGQNHILIRYAQERGAAVEQQLTFNRE